MAVAFALFASRPKPGDERYAATARDVLSAFNGGRYEDMAKNFDDTMTAMFPPAKLNDVLRGLRTEAGSFKSAGKPQFTSERGYSVVILPAEYEHAIVNFRVTFDRAGKIAGLLVRPESWNIEYRTKTPLALPFGGTWLVGWGGRTAEQNYHVIAIDQRFAYDFVRADGQSWNSPVCAPAAGVITESVDGLEDDGRNMANAAGNHLVIDHGNGEYSLIAHMRKGTVARKVGDSVRTGDLLGYCGNSGHSSEPHIHYHLQNAPHFGAGVGLPAQFIDYVADRERVPRGEPVKGQKISNQAQLCR